MRIEIHTATLTEALARLDCETHEALIIQRDRGTPWLSADDRAVAIEARVEGEGTIRTYAGHLAGLCEDHPPDEWITLEQKDGRVRATYAHGCAMLGFTHEGRPTHEDTLPGPEPDAVLQCEALRRLVAYAPLGPRDDAGPPESPVTVRSADGWLSLAFDDDVSGLHVLARVRAATRGETGATVFASSMARAARTMAGSDVRVWVARSPGTSPAIHLRTTGHRARVRCLEEGEIAQAPDEAGWRTSMELEADACTLRRFVRYLYAAPWDRATVMVDAGEVRNENATRAQVTVRHGAGTRMDVPYEALREAVELLARTGAGHIQVQERRRGVGAKTHIRWRLTPMQTWTEGHVDLVCTITTT